MLQQLKKAYVERVVDNGFDDAKIYNDNLLKLNDSELKLFENLKGIIGASKQKNKINDININHQGFTEEEWEKIKKATKKAKKELTSEEKRLLEEIKEKKKQRNDAISILRGISIRIPLLIYGADIEDYKDITVNNFTEIVDDVSWKEFMPKGITKDKFKEITKYYDNEIFIGAGRRIRNITKYADTLKPVERAKTIANLFANFRNPDKETVLTPWRTVNMHMGDTLGGWNFYDENYIVSIEEPRFINNGDVTRDVLLNKEAKILELNSKTGLYPLYVTISLFKHKCINVDSKKLTDELAEEIWKQTIEDNIYIVCKTPMAKSITKRTLIGFKNSKTNVIYDENIINNISNNLETFVNKLLNYNTWEKIGDNKMKFDAIIGNPPYQESVGNTGGNSSKSKGIYNLFLDGALNLKPNYISFIMPSRWMTKSTEGISDNWINKILSSNKFVLLHDYLSSKECFSNVEIKGGICYYLIQSNYYDKCSYYLHEDDGTITSRFDYLNHDNIGIVIRDKFANNIIEKIVNIEQKYYSKENANFSYLVSTKDLFTNKQKLTSSWDGYVINEDDEHKIKYYYNKKGKSYIAYIKESDIPKNIQVIKKNKVYIPAAAGSGNDTIVLGRPFYGEPGSVCSQTYLVIGYNYELTEEECKNICKYIKTRFFRYLVSIKKKTQNGPKMVYQFVPMENFKNNSDINWSGSYETIDKQLFEKYKLSENEINYIRNKISEIN